MKLGIVYKNGKAINHRSLLKVLLNPILRYFGIQIATYFIENQPGGLKITNCNHRKILWDFKYEEEYDFILKKRILI